MVVPVHTRAEQLLLLGGRRAFDRALDRGEIQRVLRGTYVAGDVVVDLEVRARAARRVLPEGAYLADRCLLWIWGVDVLPPGAPVLEAVVKRGAVIPRRKGISVREALLPDKDVGVWDGIACLRPARAVADLLRLLALPEALVVADASLREALVTPDVLTRELADHAALRGVRQALYVAGLADARAESPPESKVRLLLLEAGLEPVPQYDVFDGHRWLARVDLAFPALKIAIEYDGLEAHTGRDAFVRDRRRQNDLVRAGWIVLRFTAKDLTQGRVLSVVLDALRRTAA